MPGYETSAWYGIGAPHGTPADVVDRIHREIDAGLADPKMRTRFAELGGAPMPLAPAEFSKLIAEETDKWAKVIHTGNLKPKCSSSSGPRASCALKLMSAQDARGPKDHEKSATGVARSQQRRSC